MRVQNTSRDSRMLNQRSRAISDENTRFENSRGSEKREREFAVNVSALNEVRVERKCEAV